MVKLIIVMEVLADVGLGHFVDLVSQTGMAHLEHQEYFGALWCSIRSTLVLSVFSFLNLTENSTSAAVGVSPLPSERAPDSQLCISLTESN